MAIGSLIFITLLLLVLFLWCYLRDKINQFSNEPSSESHTKTRDIACSQVCDFNNPGAMTMCSAGRGQESKEACNIYYTCVNDCRHKQLEEIKKSIGLPINPEESWGSRYSHLSI